MTRVICICTAIFLFASALHAEPQASQPAAGELRYQVIAVEGKVRAGPESDSSLNVNGPGWFTPKVGDLLGAGLQIRVPLRSKIKFVAQPADPPTVLMIESMSNVCISELAFKNGAATSRIKLGYGAIRAGVMEGQTRSDMEIEAPTATLSKKGTDIFRMEYHDRHFNMMLSDQGRGQLQAIQNQISGRSIQRFVTPGQFVTQSMARAIDNMKFSRSINVNDQFGLSGNDKLFTLVNDRGGVGFLIPGNNGNLQNNNHQATEKEQAPDQNTTPVMQPFGRVIPAINAGAFGIGQGTLQGVQNARTQFGAARLQKATNATSNPQLGRAR
jgi:hypothetical protein